MNILGVVLDDFRNRFKRDIVYATIHGSSAYGLEDENSDLDVKIIYWETKREVFGFDMTKNHSYKLDSLGDKIIDVTVYPLRHFINQILKANFTFLELLFVDESSVLVNNNFIKLLKDNKDKLYSKQAFYAFDGACFRISLRINKLAAEHSNEINNLKKMSKELCNFYRIYNNCLKYLADGYFDTMTKDNQDKLRKIKFETTLDQLITGNSINNELRQDIETKLKEMKDFYLNKAKESTLDKVFFEDRLIQEYMKRW